MTLLDAVNLCLRSIGETGLTSLAGNHPRLTTILDTIRDTSRALQSRGWWFNESEDRTLTPTGGQIDASAYTLVVPNRDMTNMHVADGVLVDSTTGEPIAYPVTARVRWEIPTTEAGWADLPSTFQMYLAASAALDFASNYDADQAQVAKLQARVNHTRVMVNADDIRARRVNLYRHGSTGINIGRAYGGRYGRYS